MLTGAHDRGSSEGPGTTLAADMNVSAVALDIVSSEAFAIHNLTFTEMATNSSSLLQVVHSYNCRCPALQRAMLTPLRRSG